MTRWLLPVALLLALIGYFGPWVNHAAAGLVITGLDLGEYVKFMPVVRSGEVRIWREGFYTPLVAVSASSILYAYRRNVVSRWLRFPLLTLSLIATLNLLPPAWTPSRLVEPEFRLQTGALIGLLLGIGLAPFLALIPRGATAAFVTVLSLTGIAFPMVGFLAVLPAIGTLYNRQLTPAWGLWLMVSGLTLLVVTVWRVPITVKQTSFGK